MTEPKHDDAWQRAVLDLDEAEVKRLLATDPSLVNQPIVHYRGNGTTFQLSPIVKAGQSLTVTKLLVEAGADVNDCTSDGRALPLNGPGFEVGVYLIEHGADIDKFGYENLTPLAYAVYVGNQPLVEHLISRGAQLDRAHPAEGIAPLHYAARKSSAAMVRVLLTAGASPEAKDAQGKTPLDWAEAEGRDEAILALLR